MERRVICHESRGIGHGMGTINGKLKEISNTGRSEDEPRLCRKQNLVG